MSKTTVVADAANLLGRIGMKADIEVVSAMVMGTLVSLTRSPSNNHDPQAIGERLWAALRT